jgi:hypothetical protein
VGRQGKNKRQEEEDGWIPEKQEVNGTDQGLCPIAGFVIRGVNSLDSATNQLNIKNG